MKSNIITFWSPVSRQGACSTNAALFFSYLSAKMELVEKAVLFSLNSNIDSVDYVTSDKIREGIKDLTFLKSSHNLMSEDVLAYTHKLSDNLDILGTGKDSEQIRTEYKVMLDILSIAYNWIVIDCTTSKTDILDDLIEISDITVICLPQDKFVCEGFTDNMDKFIDQKVIYLCSCFNSKSSYNLNALELLLPGKIYKISDNNKVSQAVNSQSVSKLILNMKKSELITELDEIYRETKRLLSISEMNIDYKIADKSKEPLNSDPVRQNFANKVLTEYKFLRTKNNIVVINTSEGAGSTFICCNLAYLLSDKHMKVSVIEIPHKLMKTDIYCSLCSDEYISVSESIVNKDSERSKSAIIRDNIKFYINNKNVEGWGLNETIEYYNCIGKESAINIYDIGSQPFDESIDFILNVTDIVIVVIDPMPYRILQSEEKIKAIKELNKNIDVIYVLNKYIKDLDKKDIEKYFNIKISSCIPFIEPETLYAAAYSETVVYKIKKDDILKDALTKILCKTDVLGDTKQKEFGGFISLVLNKLKLQKGVK